MATYLIFNQIIKRPEIFRSLKFCLSQEDFRETELYIGSNFERRHINMLEMNFQCRYKIFRGEFTLIYILNICTSLFYVVISLNLSSELEIVRILEVMSGFKMV